MKNTFTLITKLFLRIRRIQHQDLFWTVACAIIISPVECAATCYTVYDKSDEPIYRSFDPPFDLSIPTSQAIASKYPGGYLLASETYSCPPIEKKGDSTFKSVNEAIKDRVAKSKRGQIEQVHTQSYNNVDSENAARIHKETASFQVQELAKTSSICSNFGYFWGDELGKELAKDAKAECLNNEVIKKTGDGVGSREAYSAWKNHYEGMSKQRQASAQGAQNSEAQRRLNNKLGDIEQNQKKVISNQEGIRDTVKDIRNTQKYGY